MPILFAMRDASCAIDRRLLVALAATALSACGGSASPEPVTPADRVYYTDERGMRRSTVSGPTDTVFKAPENQVQRAVLAAYRQLGIPAGMDPSRRQIGNGSLDLMHEHQGKRLSQFFNCGQDVNGVKADNYRLTVSIVSTIRPGGEGTLVTTDVHAQARDVAGTSTSPITCGTTGRLEQMLHEAIRNQLLSM